jgi:predicted membrane chloride channel (bestrophin family)
LNKLRIILSLINLKSLLVTVLAVASTYWCLEFELTANFPLTLIATAIVFPVVFSIGGAYNRREAALDDYGAMKAHGRALYFATRDWLDSPEDATVEKSRELLGGLFRSCRELFTNPVRDMRQNEEAVYAHFSELSLFIKHDLRGNGLASGEVSRCNQFLSKMFISFESIKHVYQYRTPKTLRAFSDVFITILPPLYGPYFAAISVDYSPNLTYVMPVLFSLILVSLDNIQSHLEDPFDQVGEDDLAINAERFVDRLT